MRTPDGTAVVFETQQLTYRQLDERANRFAAQLRERAVGPGSVVGICAARSLDMMIGLLAVLKSGAAYVPLDPAYPKDRIAFMLEDSGAAALLTQKVLQQHFQFPISDVICLDAPDETQNPKLETGSSKPNAFPENPAYVIYTSGSTGRPKGVMVSHRNVMNFFAGMDAVIGADPGVWLALTSISFDISALELFWTLTRGFTVVIHGDESNATQPWLGGARTSIAEEILRHDVTHLQCTPSQAALMVEDSGTFAALRRLKKLLLGGEALPAALARRLAGRGELFNMYGPTETTIWSAAAKLSPEGDVTIGKPIANTDIYFVDENIKPVAAGEAGEMLIGGEGVALGYLHQPELTAQKFIPDRFGKRPGARLYRTGDLGRLRADGLIEFLGRADQQIKLRGHRIELGEIESVLERHPCVRQAVVVAREDRPGDRRLFAYIVPRAGNDDSTGGGSDTLAQWQAVWDGTYSGDKQPDPEFNIAGWRNSYTGEPIPPEEMREWVEHAVERVLALKPRRILEIGCGTGLLLFRLASHCEFYCGTDFSPAAVSQLEKILAARGQKLPVKLLQRAADDFDALEPESFDTVVLNSVVQYFPGADYLLRVLEGAARLVKPGGNIFIGDVRNFSLIENFYASIETALAEGSLTVGELNERIKRRAGREEELALAPEFFFALEDALPEIGGAQILLKRGKHQNELTRFRYDVVLPVDGKGCDSANAKTALSGNGARGAKHLAEFANRPASNFSRATLPQELRRHLKDQLPEFMAPSGFVFLEKMPLTPNGKVDRKSLPKPGVARTDGGASFSPAKTALEKKIAALWEDLLQIERVGLHNNFFDLGGHSLLLAQMHARLRETLGRDFPIARLFQFTTVSALAKFFSDGADEIGEENSIQNLRERAVRQRAAFGRVSNFKSRVSRLPALPATQPETQNPKLETLQA